MATTTLKGIVKEILPVEYYGQTNEGRRQTLVLFVPGYTNQYGEKLSRDETWGIEIYNQKIEEFGLNSNCLSKKAEVDVYISGREWKKDDKVGYSFSCTLKSIKLGDIIQNPQMATSNDDGIPF